MSQPERKEVRIFNAALEVLPAKRATYLEQACAGDAALRQQVEALLQACGEAEEYFKTSAGPGARLITPATVVLPVTEKPGDRIGRYKLREKVGEGGCGVVYVADQEEPVRRRVALKVIKLGMDSKSVVARFEAERQALAVMEHPNIAKVLDAGATESGRPYFVMELVRGIKITDYCDQNNLSTRDRLDLFIKVCHAVQHAHQKGIIHRDLKPSNILVTLHDGVPVPKVIDFGIAKATEGRLTALTIYTELHQFIGTPAYVSPEQAEMSGLDIDTRADIYSLGVLLYELLTGQPPFSSEELLRAGFDEMRRTIREKEPRRPSTRLSTMLEGERTALAKHHSADALKLINLLRGDLDWIVMKALEKDRARRYETANNFAQDIQRHLSDEPVLARPPSLAYKFQRAVRRNKGAFAAAAAVFVALLTGLGLTAWQTFRAQRAQARAEQAAALARQESIAAHTARQQADQQRTEAEHGRYTITMNLVQQAWGRDDIELVHQLLNEIAASPDRGFEWYYWQRETHRDLRTTRGPTNEAWSVAFSPDLRRVATGNEDSSVNVWDAGTGQQLVTLRGHSREVTAVAFSPDGHRILTGSADGAAKIWDAFTGREMIHLYGHSNEVYFGSFSKDGQRIVTCSEDGTARIWDAATGTNLITLRSDRSQDLRFYTATFSHNRREIVTGDTDGVVQFWDSATGNSLRTLQAHPIPDFSNAIFSNAIYAVVFSPDGRRIAIGSGDKSATVWDVGTGRQLLTLRGHSSSVGSIAFSPDGSRIATASADKSARIWDAVTGKELISFRGHYEEVVAGAFLAEGRQIMTGGSDGMVKVWDADEKKEWSMLRGHSNDVRSVAFSPNGQRFITGSGDGSAKIWDANTGTELIALRGRLDAVTAVAFSPDGSKVATGQESAPRVWDASTGKELFECRIKLSHVDSLCFSPDSRRLFIGGGAAAYVCDAATGEHLKGHGYSHPGPVRFSPNCERVATGSHDGMTKIWDAATGQLRLNLRLPRSRGIAPAAFSPDGQRIAMGSYSVKIADANTGLELLTLYVRGALCLAFSPDGRRLVTGSGESGPGVIKIWDTASGRELLTLPHPSGTRVYCIAFSPDGRRIVSGNGDGTVEKWEAAPSDQVRIWREADRVASRR